MSNVMRTAVFTDVKKIELQECERPVHRGNKVLVKIDATAICTWEQRVYTGVNKVEFPFIGGHEIAAHIVEMGEEVNRQEWAVGDKVVVGATLQCRNCFYCKTGNSQSCDHFNHSVHLEGMPHKGMGGLSEYMLVSPDCMFKYDNVTPEEASIPLVLHGTSGVPDEDVKDCIARGICKVNYATDLRIAYTHGVNRVLRENAEIIDPKKYGAAGREEVKAYVSSKIAVCGSVGQIKER